MHIDEIGVDDSVATVFSPERLAKRLGDLPVDARVVDGSLASRSTCDAVVTLEHRESFLDLDWVHSIQAGVDRFPHDRFREDGVVLTNSTGIHGDAVGETVAEFVLALARRLHDIVSPHCAAYTRDYYRHVGNILEESVQRVDAGEDPVNRVL